MGKKKSGIWPYLLIAPALIIVVAVVFIPVINAVSMSFQSYDLRRPNAIEFIGLKNYMEVFADELFWKSLSKTVLWVVFGVGFQFIFGFMLALILNKKFRGRGIVRSVSLIPWVTPGVLIGLMWKWIYDGNYGVLNDILMRLHMIEEPVTFLANTTTAFPSVILTIIWQGIPFFAIMILAGLQGIPQELYEAADIDGATGIQKLFRITIPSLKNTLFVTTLLRIIWVTNSVDVILNMTGGGPAYATQTLSVYIFNKANSMNLGYSSAMAIIMTLCLGFVAVPYLKSMFAKEAE
ncbi:carbohydrate ABC transporter permease [Youxingia wuxianensis]|uniref:Sugar ABC transporter permease n=1 Tax=Youxingia wuxianensis TaxID=2763678 RepID=A0A926EU25_9FIRM|nr:sugar ABC transporter permease [Youxingia wuxianensis]MBC8586612.1 sugar ABC transporter permease [Youxingia wuxianensis]